MTTFPHVPTATRCACCGIKLTRGGYLVPAIGAVGPQCQKKFGPLADIIRLLNGRPEATLTSEDARNITTRLMIALRMIGVTVTRDTGTIRIGALTRKAADVTKSYKKRREELVRDLQIASGFYGADAQAAHAQAVAA
jgi:hypothetical protein